MMFRIFRSIFIIICLLYGANSFGENNTPYDSVIAPNISPDKIDVGTFYNGAKVHVSADIPECDGAVIVMEAGHDEIELNRKGRVAGIWLNVAKVTVENVPTVYIMATSENLDSICNPATCRKLRLGVEYLRNQIQFKSDKGLMGSEFDEFMKLKTDNGSYKMDVGIDLEKSGTGQMKLAATLPIAPTIPPGTYNIRLYCFRNGEPIVRGTTKLTVESVGFARMLTNLARNHGAEYGILAIAVSMLVGILMGFVFSRMH
jgi:uncharacterized protein (TIGR02186 family)